MTKKNKDIDDIESTEEAELVDEESVEVESGGSPEPDPEVQTDELEAVEGDNEEIENYRYSFGTALIGIMEEGIRVRRCCWPEDKTLSYENGKFFITSNKRGKEEIKHFNIDVVLADDWIGVE